MKNSNLIMITIAVIFILAANISYSQNEQNGTDINKTVKVMRKNITFVLISICWHS